MWARCSSKGSAVLRGAGAMGRGGGDQGPSPGGAARSRSCSARSRSCRYRSPTARSNGWTAPRSPAPPPEPGAAAVADDHVGHDPVERGVDQREGHEHQHRPDRHQIVIEDRADDQTRRQDRQAEGPGEVLLDVEVGRRAPGAGRRRLAPERLGPQGPLVAAGAADPLAALDVGLAVPGAALGALVFEVHGRSVRGVRVLVAGRMDRATGTRRTRATPTGLRGRRRGRRRPVRR